MSYLKADGFDDAIVGVDQESQRIVYDKDKMIQLLIDRDGMTWDDAFEYLEFNTWGAYMGAHTPIYLDSIDLLDAL
jgi:hypothetical protein